MTSSIEWLKERKTANVRLFLVSTPSNDSSATSVSVADLTAAIARGDEDAFRHFHALYWKRLYAYFMVLTKANEALAGDLTQTTMIRVACRLRPIDSEAALWSWLARVARNIFIDSCRAENRRPQSVEWQDETADSPVESQANTRLTQALEDALQLLEANERSLVEQTYFDGRRQAELASDLGMTVKALESRLFRLRQKLRLSILSSLRDE